MTVIVYKDGVMAADSCINTGTTPQVCPFPKIARLIDGSLVGAAGYASDCYAVQRWFLEGEKQDHLPILSGRDNDEVDVIVARPDGSLWRNASGVQTLYPVPTPYAIGARDASMIAVTAMHLDLDAEGAVQTAIYLCYHIRGPIQVERLLA